MKRTLLFATALSSLLVSACGDDDAAERPSDVACRSLQSDTILPVTAMDDEVGAPTIARFIHYEVTLPTASEGTHAGSVVYEVGARDVGPYHIFFGQPVGIEVTDSDGNVVPVTLRANSATGCAAAPIALEFDIGTGQTARIDITPIDSATGSVDLALVSTLP